MKVSYYGITSRFVGKLFIDDGESHFLRLLILRQQAIIKEQKTEKNETTIFEV